MTKRILAPLMALIIILSALPNARALDASLDGGSRYVGGVYDELRAPSEGFAAYRSGDRWGFVDASDGEVAIAASYRAVGDFSEGYASVCDGVAWGFVNRFGAAVGECEWSAAGSFSEGLCAVRDPDDGRYGYINDEFQLVIGCDYLDARPFSDGLAAVRDEGGWLYIDEHGHELSAARYLSAGDFSRGVAAVRGERGYGAINASGVTLVECEWRSACAGEGVVTLSGSGACAFVKGDGSVTYNTGFASLGELREGLAPVCIREKWGFVSADGEIAIPALYDEVGGFSHGLAYARRGGVPGILNRYGDFTALGGSDDVGDYTGAALGLRFGESWAIYRADGSYAALGLGSVIGGEGDRFAVRTQDGCRILSTRGDTLACSQLPGASSWAKDELREAGLLGFLDPLNRLTNWSADITRAQFCAMAVRFYSLIFGTLPATDGVRFDDTSDRAVLQAAALGLVNGDGNGRFRPYDPLTREEAATVLRRLCSLIGFEPTLMRADSPADDAAISAWARDAVLLLYRAEIFRGDDRGAFRPFDHFSAEASALTLYRLLHAPGELN